MSSASSTVSSSANEGVSLRPTAASDLRALFRD